MNPPDYQVGDIVEWLNHTCALIGEIQGKHDTTFRGLHFNGYSNNYTKSVLHREPTAQIIGHLTPAEMTLVHLKQYPLLALKLTHRFPESPCPSP